MTEREDFIQRQLEAFRGLRTDVDEMAGNVSRVAGLLRSQSTLMGEMAAELVELKQEIDRTRSLAIDLVVRGPERNPTIRRARQQMYGGA